MRRFVHVRRQRISGKLSTAAHLPEMWCRSNTVKRHRGSFHRTPPSGSVLIPSMDNSPVPGTEALKCNVDVKMGSPGRGCWGLASQMTSSSAHLPIGSAIPRRITALTKSCVPDAVRKLKLSEGEVKCLSKSNVVSCEAKSKLRP